MGLIPGHGSRSAALQTPFMPEEGPPFLGGHRRLSSRRLGVGMV